ncbi:hypothetical protein Peur_072891 [Populus x canadensis]
MTSPLLSLKKACKAFAFAQDLWLQQLNSSAAPSVSSFLNRSPFHPSHRSFTNIKPVIFSSDSAAPGPCYWISMNAIFVDEAASSSNKNLMRKSLDETVKGVLGFKDNVVSSLNPK